MESVPTRIGDMSDIFVYYNIYSWIQFIPRIWQYRLISRIYLCLWWLNQANYLINYSLSDYQNDSLSGIELNSDSSFQNSNYKISQNFNDEELQDSFIDENFVDEYFDIFLTEVLYLIQNKESSAEFIQMLPNLKKTKISQIWKLILKIII